MTSTTRSERPHVVVVGGGFAGINAAHALAHSDADVTLVDRHNYRTFQPLPYQVSTGDLPPEEVGAAFRSVFRRQADLTVRVAVVVSIDWTVRKLRLKNGSTLEFDNLILAEGAETNFFGVDGMAEHALEGRGFAQCRGLALAPSRVQRKGNAAMAGNEPQCFVGDGDTSWLCQGRIRHPMK
jgi:NADH dehydrogenase